MDLDTFCFRAYLQRKTKSVAYINGFGKLITARETLALKKNNMEQTGPWF